MEKNSLYREKISCGGKKIVFHYIKNFSWHEKTFVSILKNP